MEQGDESERGRVDRLAELERRAASAEARLDALLHHMGDVLVLVSEEGRVVWASPNVVLASGYGADELSGVDGFSFVHPDDLPLATERLSAYLEGAAPAEPTLIRLRRRDGSWRWQEMLASRVGPEPFGSAGLLICIRDAHHRVLAEEAVHASEARLAAVLANSADVTALVHLDGSIEYVNPRVRSLLGYEPEEVLQLNAADLIHPDDLPAVQARLYEGGDPTRAHEPMVIRLARRDRGWVQVEAAASDIRGPDGEREAVVVGLRRVWRKLELERQLQRSERQFRAVVEASRDAIVVVGANGEVRFASPSTFSFFGAGPALLPGASALDLVHPDDRRAAARELAALVADRGGSREQEIRVLGAGGQTRWVSVAAVNLLGDPDVAGIVATIRDITNRKELEQRLAHAASHDPLTGLANRTRILEMLDAALAYGQQVGVGVGFIFLELEGMRHLRHSIGHRGGDRVLCQLAEQLAAAARPGDSVGRWDGDEFGVVCEVLEGRDDLVRIASQMQQAVTGSVAVSGRTFDIGARAGAAIWDGCSDTDALVHAAGDALAVARSQAGGIELAGDAGFRDLLT